MVAGWFIITLSDISMTGNAAKFAAMANSGTIME